MEQGSWHAQIRTHEICMGAPGESLSANELSSGTPQIFYKTGRLRVAIMTANMVPYDWDWIENVWCP